MLLRGMAMTFHDRSWHCRSNAMGCHGTAMGAHDISRAFTDLHELPRAFMALPLVFMAPTASLSQKYHCHVKCPAAALWDPP